MNGYEISRLVETALLLQLGLCFVVIMGTAFHDIWLTKRLQATRALPRKRPHITVIVYAHNSASIIENCLTSIIKNRYRQYDIVVVNNHSTDETKAILLRYKHDHPAARLGIYNKRKYSAVQTALQQAYTKSHHGEIILSIRAEVLLPRTFLGDSVGHFIALGGALGDKALMFNEYIPTPQSLALLFWHFSQVSRQLVRKVSSHVQTRKRAIGKTLLQETYASLCTPLVLKQSRLSVQAHYVYDSRLAVLVIPKMSILSPRNISRKNRGWFYLFELGAVVCIGYSILMAATLQNTSLLLIGWAIVVVWATAATWSDEALDSLHKGRLSMAIPSLYFIIPLIFLAHMITSLATSVFKISYILVRSIVKFYASQSAPLQDW